MKLTLLILLTCMAPASALTLLDAGKTDYQIVLPDAVPTPAIDASLQQTARLLQTAFWRTRRRSPFCVKRSVMGPNRR
ncbi:MAG: hypothetical protein IPK32_20290 [Verrucomicrobiaceae bacterium]|nr:hypothetical protein [Verrucomicrobiaceae bacterium]